MHGIQIGFICGFRSSECDTKYELDRIYEDLVSKEKAGKYG